MARMRKLTDSPKGEDGDLNEEQAAEFDRAKAELEGLETRIERAEAVEDAERRIAAPTVINGDGTDGRFEDRARSFSLVKAIAARLDPGSVDDGFEREISGEVRNRTRREFQGIACPDEYFQVPAPRAEQRTLLTTGDAAALYPETHRGDLFIDLLRSALVVGRLGATVLDNLVGDTDIPRQIASGVAQWVAEDGPLSETDLDTDDVTLTPKTVGSVTSYSRRTLINSVPSVEAVVRRDLAAVIANAIDLQAMVGDGTTNTPVGVINQTGVNTASLVTPTWAEVLAFIAAVQADDADIGAMGWALPPQAVAVLRATERIAGAAGGFLMDAPNAMAGFPAAVTTSLFTAGTPNVATVIFGSWSQLLIGYWSGLDILVNPFESAAYLRGRVLIRAMRDVDVAVRHGESFAFAEDLPGV